METFLFGVYIVVSVYVCWLGLKFDEDTYPEKREKE